MPFETFWNWVVSHPNCLVRVGTPETSLFDDDDLHWVFDDQTPAEFLVQLVRGKRLVGEIVVQPELVTYVEATTGDSAGEFVFDLISESESDRVAAYSFVVSHAFESEEQPAHGPVH
ncbi:MAG: hypothetical protein ABI609_06785 [Acidobacteriota bacterium]